jgi:hypothetical protein
MTDWNTANVSTTYASLVGKLTDRDIDCATMFDGSASTNLPVNSIRWNSTNYRFEQWSGSAWVPLVLSVTGGGTGASSASGARTSLGSTVVGDAVFVAASTLAARTAIGITATGDTLVTAANAGAARTALGSTAVGDAVFVATNAGAARTAIGVTSAIDGLLTVTTLAQARSFLGVTVTALDNFLTAATLSAARGYLGLGDLALKSTVTGGDVAPDTITLYNLATEAKAYDIPFAAGFGPDFNGQDILVQAYGDLLISRNLMIEGEVGYIDTPSTGAALIVDVLKNGTTIYSTKPQFAAGSNSLTSGTMSTTTLSSGDRITFKVTQVGSGTRGQKARFTLKARLI